jgi:hypothetical protein
MEKNYVSMKDVRKKEKSFGHWFLEITSVKIFSVCFEIFSEHRDTHICMHNWLISSLNKLSNLGIM